MKIGVKRKDAVWSYLAIFLSMGASVILVPFVLVNLNDTDTALYYIFSSLSAIAVLFDFGFSPAMARSMAYAWSGSDSLKREGVDESTTNEPNYVLMNKIITACKLIYTSLAIIALLLALTIGTYYITYITRNEKGNHFFVAWFIYAIAIFFNILYSYYSVFLRGIGVVDKVNIATVVSKLAQMVVCIVLLLLKVGLLGVSIAYLLYGLTFRILAKHWFYNYNNIKQRLKESNNSINYTETIIVLRTIWPNTWRDGVVTLSNYLLNQATTIIASLFLSLQDTGIYSLTVQLTSVIATVSSTMYTTYQPALQSAYANRNTSRQKQYMSLIIVSFVFLFWAGIIALITIGIPIVKVIKPTYTLSVGLILTVGFYQFLLKLRNCYTSFISTTNRVSYWKAFLFSAILCVVMAYLFVGSIGLGLYGLVIAQLISQMIYNAWYWPIVVHKELKLSPVETIKLGVKEIKSLIKGHSTEN